MINSRHRNTSWLIWYVGLTFTFYSVYNITYYALNSKEACASDRQEFLDANRLRNGIWLGLGLSGGSLGLVSSALQFKSEIDQLPTINLGGDVWGSESRGLYVQGRFGLGAELGLPPQYGGKSLFYNQHQLAIGGQYRWHMSLKPLSPSIQVRLGLYGQSQYVDDQNPTLFVNRATYGPETSIGLTVPASDKLWIRATGGVSVIILVREDPADSGEVNQGMQWSLSLDGVFNLNDRWGVYVHGAYSIEEVSFSGAGTRAGGVINAKSTQDTWSTCLGARYRMGKLGD